MVNDRLKNLVNETSSGVVNAPVIDRVSHAQMRMVDAGITDAGRG